MRDATSGTQGAQLGQTSKDTKPANHSWTEQGTGAGSAPSDVCGHALEGHHGNSAGLLGNAGLLHVGNVHDNATLKHLGEPGLNGEGSLLLLHCDNRWW